MFDGSYDDENLLTKCFQTSAHCVLIYIDVYCLKYSYLCELSPDGTYQHGSGNFDKIVLSRST